MSPPGCPDGFFPVGLPTKNVCGITRPLGRLSPRHRQIAHVLRTRSPVGIATPRDLHVLSTPPAFVLSQDQTLQEKNSKNSRRIRCSSPERRHRTSLHRDSSICTASGISEFVYCLSPLRTSTTDRREPSHDHTLDCQKATASTAWSGCPRFHRGG